MRIFVILTVVALVSYLLFQCIRSIRLLRASAELVRQSSAFERLNEEGSPRILILGDSTGVGTGVTDPNLSIAGRFGADFPSAYIQNESRNGWKIADALNNFPVVPPESFDIILLQIGANDIIRATPLAEFSASLNKVFEMAQRSGKHVIALHSGNIGLAPFFPWPISRIMRSRTLLYRAPYRRIATENNVYYVDLYREKADDPFQGKDEYYAQDLLHLSAKGNAEWYRTIRELMRDNGIAP